MFGLFMGTFAFIICTIALVLNAMSGNIGWVIVMAICMGVNLLTIASSASNL
jgi:hypothetical protein